MLNLSKDKIFFFYDDCSFLKLYPYSIEHAYLLLLNQDLSSAEKIFDSLDSPRAKWAKIMVSILKGYLVESPTYFQVRNFFEIDLDFLLKNEKLEYVELLLGALDVLVYVNQEVYKYAGRVMYENKLYSAALKYFNKSKKIYYKDAELHFLLAKYYLRVNDTKEALFYINKCLSIIPDYYPARMIKQKIEETWF